MPVQYGTSNFFFCRLLFSISISLTLFSITFLSTIIISVILLILAAQGFSLASFLFHTPEDAKPCTKEGEVAEENKEKTPLWMVPGEQLVLIEGMNQVLLPSGKIICLCSWLWYHII